MTTWRGHFRSNARAYLFVAIGIAVVLALADQSVAGTRRLYLRTQAPSDWIEYHSLTYLEADDTARGGLGALRIESETTIYRAVSLQFIDTLYCDDGTGEFEFVSQNPITEAFPAEARPRRSVRWLYNADYPHGRPCEVRSVISATVDGITKKVRITTPVFVVPGD